MPELDDPIADRPDLSELSVAELDAIEQRIGTWPDSWRDIARSLYVTLVSRAEALAPAAAAGLATELMHGVAADLGGSQPYINQPPDPLKAGQAGRVIELLAFHRQDYARVAQIVKLSERHVRRIEARWLRAERARRQAELDLDPNA